MIANVYRILLVMLVLFSSVLHVTTTEAGENKFKTGIAVTPRNLPSHSQKDVDDAFRIAAELGTYAVFIFQWHDLNPDLVRQLMSKTKSAKLIPIIGLSPTTLDQGRKELDLPENVRRKAGGRISFENPVIREEFIRAAKELAELKPAYLCLATEINFLALQRLDEYLRFVTLYKEAYHEIKRISPDTNVFVSFQWEWIRIVDSKEMNNIKEHSKVISIFKPELDLIGLTTYPSPFHENPSSLPNDYYTWIYNHLDRSDTVLLMEVGWPTSGTGTEDEQNAFIKRLPFLLKDVNVPIVAWALLHDVKVGAFDANLNTVGLLTTEGKRKKAYNSFRELNR